VEEENMSKITINDLNETTDVTTAQAAEVKGGPAYIKFDGVDGECRDSVPTDSFSLNFTKISF